jgi:hypothetical protein
LEDASWVGLGWSLSPGAINRVVNGYADDHKNVSRFVHDKWEGGERHTFSVGTSIGKSSIQADLGLVTSFDTYQGFDGSVSIGLSIGEEIPGGSSLKRHKFGVSRGISIGTSGVDSYSNASYSITNTNTGFTAGISGNLGSIGASVSRSNGSSSASLLGANMSTKGLKPSLSIAGAKLLTGNSNLKVSTAGISFKVPVGYLLSLPVPLNVGYSYQRYWTDERDEVKTFGSLYGKDSYTWTPTTPDYNANDDDESHINSVKGPDGVSFDCQIVTGIGEERDPNFTTAPSFPMYDAFQVSGQGVVGSIEPRILEDGLLFRQKGLDRDSEKIKNIRVNYMTHIGSGNSEKLSKKVNFGFVNDFSNAYRYTTAPSTSITVNQVGSFKHTSINAHNGVVDVNSDGFNSTATEDHLAGSKHVEWFTNQEIIDGLALNFFDNAQIDDAKRGLFPDQIGGYSITNESGITYHYGLPVYSYDEYHESLSTLRGNSWNKQSNPEHYAYTWLLTGITGSDYIDRGTINALDEDDWGYWVSFDYGMWTDQYEWRTPFDGKNIDINGTVQNLSYGKKEIYYLDAIKTRTHTALFIKDERKDAKGITGHNGGFAIDEEAVGEIICANASNPDNNIGMVMANSSYPVSQLKLTNILLLKNDKLSQLISSDNLDDLKDNDGTTYELTFNTSVNHPQFAFCPAPPSTHTKTFHIPDNVITTSDLSGLNLESNSLKSMWFNTDYSLCPETSNSFDHSNLYQHNPTIPTQKFGKLTLNSIEARGIANQSVLPMVNFGYEDPNPTTIGFDVKDANTLELYNLGEFEAGDIAEFTIGNNTYYCLLLNGGLNVDVEFLGLNKIINSSMSGTLKKCNNPPFNAQKYDNWGYYKPDIPINKLLAPSDVGRCVNDISAPHQSAWSLRSVENMTGSTLQINYEPKVYENAVLDNQHKMYLNVEEVDDAIFTYSHKSYKHLIPKNNTPSSMTFKFREGINLNSILQIGDNISCNLLIGEFKKVFGQIQKNKSAVLQNINATVSNVTSSELTVNNFTFPSTTDSKTDGFWMDADAGFVTLNLPANMSYYGNGSRVKSIQVLSPSGEDKTTEYNYFNGTISYNPFGASFTTPLGTDHSDPNAKWDVSDEFVNPTIQRLYRQRYTANWHNLKSLIKYVPAPNVMYEKVEMTSSSHDKYFPGKIEYNFRIFDENMLQMETVSDPIVFVNNIGSGNQPEDNYDTYRHVTNTIKDKTSQVGNLLSVIEYSGLGQVTTATEYDYIDDGDAGESENDYDILYDNQGVMHQAFREIKRLSKPVSNDFDDNATIETLVSTSSVYKKYPTILASTTKMINGISMTTKNKKYDFYSGEPIEIETENSYGEKLRATSIPAYQAPKNINDDSPQYESMGLKVYNIDNKNMLSQSAGSKLEKIDAAGNVIGVVSASTTTWKGDWSDEFYSDGQNNDEQIGNSSLKTWRKHKSYVYQALINDVDGTFSTFQPFNFDWLADNQVQGGWEKTSEITLYNHYSKPLEVMDMNGNYAATKMGYDESVVLATAANARYKEFAYASGESGTMASSGSSYDGGVVRATGAPTSTAHTGNLGITSSGKGFKYTVPIGNNGVETDKTYRASVWIHQNKINPTTIASIGFSVSSNNSLGLLVPVSMSDVKAGDWKLVSVDINLPQGTTGNLEVFTTGSGITAIFDDFRFHPLDASMTSYVYDEATGQLRFILDAENFFTEYEYNPDGSGRLYKTYRETTEIESGKRIISKHEMNYKQ